MFFSFTKMQSELIPAHNQTQRYLKSEKLNPSPDHQKITASYLVNAMYPKQTKTKIPKSLIVFFMVLQICFGMDLGFNKIFGGTKRKFIKIITNLVSLIILTILIAPYNIFHRTVWYWCTLVKYTCHFLTFNCLKMPKYQMYDFLNEMHNLEDNVPAIESNVFGTVILTYTSIMWFLKGAFVTTRCIIGRSRYCLEANMYLYSVYTVFALSADIVSGILIIILYYVYSFIRHTKNMLRSELDVIKFERRYIAIADCYNKIKQLYDYIITVELCINTPRLMATLWCMLLFIKENAEWYSYTSEWLFAFHLTIQMCIPAVVAEMVNCQIDDIKLTLNEQRREEQDPQRSAEITRILRYVKARRLQSFIWRVVPVDVRLPMALLSVCTTYFIVILQFTHLYD